MPKWVIGENGDAFNLDVAQTVGRSDPEKVVLLDSFVIAEMDSPEACQEFIRIMLTLPDEVVLASDIKAMVQEGGNVATQGNHIPTAAEIKELRDAGFIR